MIRIKKELITDQRTEQEKLRDKERIHEISNVTLGMDYRKNKKISFDISEDTKNLIEIMAELANMNISEFIRYLIAKEHRRLGIDILDGIPINANKEEDRQRIFDQIMRSVL